MSLRYSPLCDTSLVAYLAYCFGKDGVGSVQASPVDGAGGGQGGVDGNVDFVRDLSLASRGGDSTGQTWMALLASAALRVGEDGVVNCGGGTRVEGAGSSGLASDSSGDFHRVGGGNNGVEAGVESVGDADGVSVGEPGRTEAVLEPCARGKHYERNRLKKEKKKLAKVTARAGAGSGRSAAEKLGSADWRSTASAVSVDDAVVSRGYFAGCSDEVRRNLRESRAKMLVAQNEMRAIDAEHKLRQTQARLTARMVEEEVEKKRLDLALALDSARKRAEEKLPVGFAETVVSEGLQSVVGTPSLSSGSVSPNSSISVSELRRKDEAIRTLIAKVAVLEGEKKKNKRGGVFSSVSGVSDSDGVEPVIVDDAHVRAARDVVFGGNLRMTSREVVGGDGYSQWDIPVTAGKVPSAAEDAAMLARCKEENSTAELIAPGTVISRF